MNAMLRKAWRHHRLLLLAFGLALALSLSFSARVVMSWFYFAANRDAEVTSWMTVGYVARSHQVPREALFDALEGDLALTPGARETVAEIAWRTGLTEQQVIARIDAALADLKQSGQP
ncbi:hypothetical protein HMH01_07405 [Halovulum dunhuangense]|uniref:Uncharacterized protein n=1 Tax=Halovulum dunhuangense TaxID=1505036 RepID=A0A849L1Z2_9RHOB|nr:AsnC family protein [Halovulum dunhuangense]NNU80264.1 hypothetical protein [Halovulum dunhuangense]